MRRHGPRLLATAFFSGLVAAALILGMPGIDASNPRGAYYSADTDKVFWFIQASDLHVGASGSSDADNLRWLATTAREMIQPAFVVVTGDIVDATNGGVIPSGPYQAEWNEYNSILSGTGIDHTNWYDLPGNHDAYNDATFVYYRANSIQGRRTNQTQHSWTRTFSFGTYHFLGVNTAANNGASFSIFFPYGDRAGLDATELSFIDSDLSTHAEAALTMVFGHHPVTDTGESGDTWLFYGQQEFISSLDLFRASSYGYGHTHANPDTHFTGNAYTGTMSNGGIRYPNVNSLGKDNPPAYRLFAVDCDGVSSVTQTARAWPLVMITAPLSKYVGSALNPYNYRDPLPKASNNPVRALVFDANAVTSVTFTVDGGVTIPMAPDAGNAALWTGMWNASALSSGEHVIRVTANSASGSSYHQIRVEVGAASNQPPVANADYYTTIAGRTLTVAAPGVLANDTDPEGTTLTAEKLTDPGNGTLSFNANGSFTYTPTAEGTYSFTYQARDASGAASAPATVNFAVASAPPADSVTIASATWSSKTKKLSVTATSSAQPGVTLTLYIGSSTTPAGTMGWNAKRQTYTLSTSVPTKPATVTVKSSGGGTATKSVS